MTDTRLGTYGCVALILYVTLKLHLTALGVSDWNVWRDMRGAGPSLLAAHTAARCTAPYMIRTNNYVDETGPKSQFYSFMAQAKILVDWHRVGFAIFTTIAILSLLYGSVVAVEIVCLCLVLAHFAGKYATSCLGGVMGDFLGATICVTELVVYIAILVLTSAGMPRTWAEVLESVREARYSLKSFSVFDLSDLLGSLQEHTLRPSHPVHVWCRFIVVMAATTLWCSFVGHPNVLAGDTTIKSQNRDTKQSSMDAASTLKADNNRSTCGPNALSEGMLEELSFRERYEAARAYIDTLAKPVGSLGTLEEWAARLVSLQGSNHVLVDPVGCLIFVADHGVAADQQAGGENCSSFPQSVTRCIVEGLDRGIAGASVLARQNGVEKIRVVDVGVVGGVCESTSGAVVTSYKKLQGGTHNFCLGPAMTLAEAERCMQIGRDELNSMVFSESGAKAVVLGEVGIGNTTSSSALIAHIANAAVQDVCGGGATTTRVPESGVIKKKIDIVTRALEKHRSIASPMDALARLGGAEIAALVGAILEASEHDIPILLDGFIVIAAALVAVTMKPSTSRIMFPATKSVEPGQIVAIAKLQEVARSNDLPAPPDPIFDMGLRMGEGTGAYLCILHAVRVSTH